LHFGDARSQIGLPFRLPDQTAVVPGDAGDGEERAVPRLPELSKDDSDPAVRAVMEWEESALGTVLNPTKLMGYRPEILAGGEALRAAVDGAQQIEPALRYLVYTFVAGRNGCPF